MFRFTVRDVLWLVLAVALALSWQVAQSAESSDRNLTRAQ
jgi:hypothetical protein